MRGAKKQEIPAGPIPDKLYFRIGEVARLCEVETYVLRFWETEFPQLKPGKSGTGQRLYRKREVEMALRVKDLLHRKGFTIAGARQALKTEVKASKQDPLPFQGNRMERARLDKIRNELREMLSLLEDGGGKARGKSKFSRQTAPATPGKTSGPQLFES